MKVKIDTKEKFTIITIQEPLLTANMTAELKDLLLPFLDNETKSVVVKWSDVSEIDTSIAEEIVQIQQTFYENNASFVICELQPGVEQFLDQSELLEVMNITPTESEAWDIIQMEEIEREYLD